MGLRILEHPAAIVLLLAIVVLLFGAKRMPDAARGLGRSLRIFKAETKALAEDGTPASSTTDQAPAIAGQPMQVAPQQSVVTPAATVQDAPPAGLPVNAPPPASTPRA